MQNYEVHIDGKPFIIGERPDFVDTPVHWLSIRVDVPEEMSHLVAILKARPELKGMHVFGADVEQLWAWFRADYHFVQAAGGAVTDEQGRLLAIHRLGRWDLPKGKVEQGEAIDAAAVREVQEECGLQDITLLRPLCRTWHTYERKGMEHLKRTDWFLMTASSAETLTAQTEEDIDEVRWVDAERMVEVRRDTYPSLQRVFNAWEEAHRGPA